ncbi:MAG: flagellar hook-basal body complex protein [Oscillospiraceae bacterium]|nr:flagellar hook-basal body complex protein [Oscillospiraceae bacterium]
MYAAVSGLKTHMNKLNVIGNNIANVNTYGYKTQRTIFEESIYATSRNGSNGTNTAGGRNPAQIGYGSQISTIDLNMSSGTYAPTGHAMDCMIDGMGFILVGDKDTADTISLDNPESLKSLQFTRVGDLSFDAEGYLVDGNGSVVYGFLTVQNANAGGGAGGGAADPDAAVTETSTYLVPLRLPMACDSDGTTVYPSAAADGGGILDATTGTDSDGQQSNCSNRVSVDSIGIDGTTGRITGINKDTDFPVTVGYLAIGEVSNPNGLTHMGGRYYKALDGAGDMSIVSLGGVLADRKLQDAGDDADVPGQMVIGNAGSTKLITGGLELSTTDLATEMTEMITTQRGYQANSRIITVTDSMLEELVNMKR